MDSLNDPNNIFGEGSEKGIIRERERERESRTWRKNRKLGCAFWKISSAGEPSGAELGVAAWTMECVYIYTRAVIDEII